MDTVSEQLRLASPRRGKLDSICRSLCSRPGHHSSRANWSAAVLRRVQTYSVWTGQLGGIWELGMVGFIP
jgi:hypothetical protein